MSNSFSTEALAAFHLLEDSTATLVRCGVEFVIVGGWSPFLFHSKKYGHPGTFDVDVLLHSKSLDDGTFDRASEELMQSGYLRAAKNPFQAHRILRVGAEDFVFYVDFLNEREPRDELEFVGGNGRMKSIYTQSMQAVFRYENYRTLPNYPGLRFPSPETFVVTKAAAARVAKRGRDAFDVFVTVQDQDKIKFSELWQKLVEQDGLFEDANQALLKALSDGDAIKKIRHVLQSLPPCSSNGATLPNEDEIHDAFSFLVSA